MFINKKIISRKKQSVLVQYEDSDTGYIHRVIVPINQVKNSGISDRVLEIGIPYGIPMEDFISVKAVTPKELAEAFRRADLWTAEDFRKYPNRILGVIRDVLGLQYKEIIQAIENYKNKEG